MGQSAPTTTMALDEFEKRYKEFRTELSTQQQFWFDELVCSARRASHAINRRPHLDFERPVLLAMLLELKMEQASLRLRLQKTVAELAQTRAALAEAGVVTRQVVPPTPEDLLRIGQTRLEGTDDHVPVC